MVCKTPTLGNCFQGKKKSEEAGRTDDAETKVTMGTAVGLIP